MSRIYSALPIPVWQPIFTFLNFIAATLSLGGAFLLLFQIQKGRLSGQQTQAWIIGIVLLLEILFIPIFFSYLDQNSPASQLSLKLLLEDYTYVFYFRLGFQILSIAFVFMSILKIRSETNECKKLMWPAVGAASFIFLNEILGRILFYAIEVPFGIM
jgi:DMSO reductase anchor subunit